MMDSRKLFGDEMVAADSHAMSSIKHVSYTSSGADRLH